MSKWLLRNAVILINILKKHLPTNPLIADSLKILDHLNLHIR
jgi:hypothetical protein